MPQLWHQPPHIVPNYGKKRNQVVPKTNVTRVLLHDNVCQQQLLSSKLNWLSMDQKRTNRLLDLHRKSFIVRQSIKQQHLRSIGISHISFLPDLVVHDAVGYRSGDKRPQTTAITGLGRKSGKSLTSRTGRPVMPPRAVTMIGNTKVRGSDENGNIVETSSLKSDSSSKRSRSAILPKDLQKNLNTFSTANYVLIKETVNDEGEVVQKHIVEHVNTNGKYGEMDKTPLENDNDVTITVSRKNSNNSKSSSEKDKQKLHRQASCDSRFLELEKCLIRTDWPVGGYTALSPCGSSILQKYGEPLYDYDQLRGLIDHYSSLPTPRRSKDRGGSLVPGDSDMEPREILLNGSGITDGYVQSNSENPKVNNEKATEIVKA